MVASNCATPSQPQDPFPRFEERVQKDGEKALPYRLLVPKAYKPGVSLPLVVWLHGSGETGADNAGPLRALDKTFRAVTHSTQHIDRRAAAGTSHAPWFRRSWRRRPACTRTRWPSWSGDQEPNWPVVLKLAGALGVECSAFKSGGASPEPDPAQPDEVKGPVERTPPPRPGAEKKPGRGEK